MTKTLNRLALAGLLLIGGLRGTWAQEGSLDMTFNPPDTGFVDGANENVWAIIQQPDGKLIIVGAFTTYNAMSANRMARLNIDGSLDTSFDPGTGANGIVRTCVLQTDGKIVIGGDFTSYNGTARIRVARLNADGSLDMGFDPGAGASNSVYTSAIQPDGKIVIGGGFVNFQGTARSYIARINSDGNLDTTFNPGTGANGIIYSLVVEPEGKIVIGGGFTSYNGTVRRLIGR